MMKIQKTSKLAKLSIAALLLGTSIASAQDVPAEAATEAAPVAEPVVSAPVAAPAPVAEPVVSAPVAAPVESAPAPKPSTELAMVTSGGTKVSLYGRLELNASYESFGRGNGQLSSMFANPEPKNTPDAQGRTAFSINRTRLGLNLEGPSKEGEPSVKGRFEADFSGNGNYDNFSGTNGSNSGFRVRQSWGSVAFKDLGLTLLFGQTDDVISPLDPPSVNPSSLNGAGNIGNRRPQIRLTQAFGPAELAIAATHDRLYNDAAGTAPAAPAFQGRLGVKLPATWAGEKANMAFGVGGLFARNDSAHINDTLRGISPPATYAIAADLSMPLMDILTLTGEFFMGQNLRRYGDGSLGLSDVRAMKDKDTLGISSMGWWAGLAAKLPADFSVGAALGMENLSKDVVEYFEEKKPSNRTSNMFMLANLAYNFTSATKLTLEWTNLSTGFARAEDGSMNRFELNFRYDFK